jgi:hypothetical protein
LLLANLSQNIFGAIFSSGLGGLTIWVPVALALGPMAVGGVANQAQWRSMALQKAEIA